MHAEALDWIARSTKGQTYGRVLEFGARDVNGTPRTVVAHVRWTGVDALPGPGVDMVCPAEAFTSVTRYDLVVCAETLEHTPNVEAIVKSAFFNLRSGGIFLVTCACEPRAPHSAIDGGAVQAGEYYGNVDGDDLARACTDAGFVVQQAEAHDRGDLYLRAKKP
jgi:predicted methyltransferase